MTLVHSHHQIVQPARAMQTAACISTAYTAKAKFISASPSRPLANVHHCSKQSVDEPADIAWRGTAIFHDTGVVEAARSTDSTMARVRREDIVTVPQTSSSTIDLDR